MSGFNLGGISVYTKQVGELFAKSIIPENLFENVEVMENVKYITAINLFEQDLYLQLDACDLSPSGSTPLTQRNLEVCELTSHDKFCMSDLNKYWTNEQLSPGSNITDLDFFGQKYLPRLGDKIAEHVQNIAWRGNTDSGSGNLGLCDGFLYVLSGTSTVNTGLTTPSVSTIVATIEEMILAIPSAIAGNELKIYLSNNLYNMWIAGWASAYGAAPFYLDNTKKNHPFYNNITFAPQSGLQGTNYIVIAEKSNMVYGTDILNEASQISVYYDPITKYVYVDVSWKQGCQVKFPELIVKNFVEFP